MTDFQISKNDFLLKKKHVLAEMEKAADAADTSVLFFSAGANILGLFVSVLFKSLFPSLFLGFFHL